MNTQYIAPNHATHIAKVGEIPDEPLREDFDRPDEPVPSLWQRSVVVRNKSTGEPALVHRCDHPMRLMRLFYPEQLDPKTKTKGRFSSKTEWESFDNWIPEVTFTPEELQRQAAQAEIDEAIAQLDAKSAGVISVLCDDPDPAKNLAKMQLIISSGMIKVEGKPKK